jgi:hypothetical protein
MQHEFVLITGIEATRSVMLEKLAAKHSDILPGNYNTVLANANAVLAKLLLGPRMMKKRLTKENHGDISRRQKKNKPTNILQRMNCLNGDRY